MLGVCLAPSKMLRAKQVSYSHDIRIILSGHCYQCHGPDGKARKADLRLDQEQGTIIEIEGVAISCVNSIKGEFLERIHSTDPEQQMPPPEVNKPLSDAQRNLINRWVIEGASWSKHQACTPLKRPTRFDLWVPGGKRSLRRHVRPSGDLPCLCKKPIRQCLEIPLDLPVWQTGCIPSHRDRVCGNRHRFFDGRIAESTVHCGRDCNFNRSLHRSQTDRQKVAAPMD